MADLQALFKEVDKLSAEEIEELYKHVAGIRTQIPATSTPQRSERVLGLHEHLGKAWMSEDFDAELPDEFWFGEK